jgi:hypothetical protein
MYGVSKMNETTHGASRIKTLRLAVGPGASAIAQLAAAMTGRGARHPGHMSVAGFFFPGLGLPALACPGRRPLFPAVVRKGPAGL